jgi:hypothetical protein
MAVFTDRYAFYLAAGGSSGTISGDDTVDVDKINDTFRRIDMELGVPRVAGAAQYPTSPALGVCDRSSTAVHVGRARLTWDGASVPGRAARPADPHGTPDTIAAYYIADAVRRRRPPGRARRPLLHRRTELLNTGALDSRLPREGDREAGAARHAAIPGLRQPPPPCRRTTAATATDRPPRPLWSRSTSSGRTAARRHRSRRQRGRAARLEQRVPPGGITDVTSAGCNVVISRKDGNISTTVYLRAEV